MCIKGHSRISESGIIHFVRCDLFDSDAISIGMAVLLIDRKEVLAVIIPNVVDEIWHGSVVTWIEKRF